MLAKRIGIGLAALALILTAGVAAVEAHQENQLEKKNNVIAKSVADNDFEAWKQAMEDKTKVDESKLTQENFDKLVEAKELMDEGKYKEANEIRKELGLKLGNGQIRKMHKDVMKKGKKLGDWIKKFKDEGIEDTNGDGVCNADDLDDDDDNDDNTSASSTSQS